MNETIVERINKDKHNELEKDEIEYFAETQDLKSQFQDNNDLQAMHERLSRGKIEILVLEKNKRLIPFNTEILDLRREAGYLERIRAYLHDLFINLESVDRLIKHTNKEIEDCEDRITLLQFERKQIGIGKM